MFAIIVLYQFFDINDIQLQCIFISNQKVLNFFKAICTPFSVVLTTHVLPCLSLTLICTWFWSKTKFSKFGDRFRNWSSTFQSKMNLNQLRKLQQSNLLRTICLQTSRPASYPSSKSFHQLVDQRDQPHNRQKFLTRISVRNDLIQLQRRSKTKKGKGKADDEESDSESGSDEESDSDSSEEDSDVEDSNIKKIETINTRLDMVLKNGR